MSVICSTVVIFRSAFEGDFEYVKLHCLRNCTWGKKGVVGRQFHIFDLKMFWQGYSSKQPVMLPTVSKGELFLKQCPNDHNAKISNNRKWLLFFSLWFLRGAQNKGWSGSAGKTVPNTSPGYHEYFSRHMISEHQKSSQKRILASLLVACKVFWAEPVISLKAWDMNSCWVLWGQVL